tara:strand:+ start:1996 stop:3372 length:1377 start_codon:yes stop_codon:yes gene_type:complete
MANTIQIKRGTTVPSSGMTVGEPLFKTDDARFFIATDATTANWVGAPILDEDNMSSNSAVKLATQQSIKAYVDSQVASGALDIDALGALGGTGLHQTQDHFVFSDNGTEKKITFSNLEDAIFGNVSGDVTIAAGGAATLANNSVSQAQLDDDAVGADELAADAVVNASIASGAAIDMDKLDGDSLATAITDFAQDDLVILSDTSDSGNLVKMTASNFEDAIFGNVSGDATIAAGGALTIAAGAVENAMLANDSVSFGGVSLDLGQSDSTPAFDLSDATNYPTSSLSGTITNAQLAGSIANAKLANSSITVSDGSNSTATALGGTITFAGTTNEVEVSESSGTITVGLPNNVTIGGNLTVSGTTTTVSSTTVTINDVNVSLAGNNSANSTDIGIYGKYVDGSTKYKGIFNDASNSDTWTFFKATGTEPTTTVNTSASGYALAGISCASVDGATIDGGTY